MNNSHWKCHEQQASLHNTCWWFKQQAPTASNDERSPALRPSFSGTVITAHLSSSVPQTCNCFDFQSDCYLTRDPEARLEVLSSRCCKLLAWPTTKAREKRWIHLTRPMVKIPLRSPEASLAQSQGVSQFFKATGDSHIAKLTSTASRAGTRSVSTLSADQLARKRANDREAQRAIRQRTREHVERLEGRIKELSGDGGDNSDAESALAEAQRRNSELEEELRILRAALAGSISGTASPDITYPQRKLPY